MQTLDRRIAELERTTAKRHYNIVIHYVNKRDDELLFLTDRNGKEWTRKPDESRQDFRARAVSEANRSDYGVVQLFSER